MGSGCRLQDNLRKQQPMYSDWGGFLRDVVRQNLAAHRVIRAADYVVPVMNCPELSILVKT